jgi:hypothetical protein
MESFAMKAYEFPAKLNVSGTLEIPEAVLKKLLPDQDIKVIVLVPEELDDAEPTEAELEFSGDRFRQSWQQATSGQTLPLSQLWEDVDVD